MKLAPVTQTASAAATISLPAILADQWFRGSVAASFTDAAAAGTLQLQASNDPPPGGNVQVPYTPAAGSWFNVGTTVSVTAGATAAVPATETAYRWVRLVYTRSAGAGTMTANWVGLAY